MKRLQYDILIALCALLTLAPSASRSDARPYTRDWSDIERRPEERTFGSEKVRRYPVDMFFIQYERWEAHRSLTILGLYRSTDYPRYTASRLWPFYDSITSKVDERRRTWMWLGPVYYRKLDTGYDYLHLFPLYTSETYRRDADRSFLYFIRWGGQSGELESSYFSVFPLLFYDGYGRRTDARDGWSIFLTPLLLYHDSTNRRLPGGEYENRLTVSPLWVRNSHRRLDDAVSGGGSTLAWWVPIIPLVYYSSGPESWHFNGLWIYDMEHRPGRLFRWFFLPLWLYNDSTAGSMNSTTSATVFHFYSHRSRREKNGPAMTVARSWWAPIVPLYYSSYTEGEGAHRNFLWLADWHTTPGGEVDRAWVMPLYWYREHRYHHLIPLWMSWRGASSFTGIGPLFLWGYHRNGPPEQGADYRFWAPAIPLVYHYSGRDGASHTNALWLFDWAHGADGSLSHFWFLPLVAHNCGEGGYRQYLPFYVRPPGWTDERGVSFGLLHYHRWAPGEETLWWPLRYLRTDEARRERVSHWMPLYYSWDNVMLFGEPATSGTVLLPFFINYEDGSRKLHIDLLGFSASSLRGPLAPHLTMSAGWRAGSWYLDTDVSWLYDVASVSARTTIRNPFGEDDARVTSPAQARAETAAPSLAARRESSRESSTEFFGWKVLFGLLAWERADSVKHFRLLPLAWFTWDEASDDRVSHLFPAYFSYRSERVEYFVLYPLLVPLYGMSRDGESTFRAFLITAFWSEYDASRHEREYTVLWPFFNWYSSPGRSGWRIFPLFWSKSAREGDSVTSSVISPLYYRSRSENTSEGAVRETVIAPFIYASSTRAGASFEQSVSFPIVPLFFYSRSENAVTENGAPFERTSHFVLPLYYWREESEGGSSDSLFIGLPLVYVHSWASPGADGATAGNRTVFALGCYTHTGGGVTHTNILGLFNWESDSSNGSVSRWLFPFFVKQGGDRDGYFSVPLLLSSYGWHGEARELLLAGLFWHRYDPASRERCLHLFPLLISRWRPDEYTLVLFGSYWHSSEHYSRWNLWYLFDHSSSADGEESYWGFAFGMAQYERTRAMRRFRLALGILAEYERSMKTPRWHARALWLGYERSGDGYAWNLLPALYHSSGPGETYTCVPLALQYYHRRGENVFHVVGAGAVYYYHRDAEERTCREMWLLGTLYNHVEKPARDLARDYRSSGSMWGLLWEYETESLNGVETWNQTSALFRLYRRVNDGGEVYHRILGISL